MRRLLVFSLVLLVTLATEATAWVVERTVPVMDSQEIQPAPPPIFYYGGTVWDAFDFRWEAAEPSLPGWASRKMWTWSADGFGGVPHSGENMDGWVGVDNTYMAPEYFDVKDNATLGATCVIAGTKSLFCGAGSGEGYSLCFVDENGTGYGNSWKQGVHTPTYSYVGVGQVTLTYDCTYESEAGYDFTYVILQVWDSIVSEFVDLDTLASYTGLGSTSESLDIDSHFAGLTPPVDFRIVFQFVSDAGYSDSDGLNPTACGAFTMDTYSLENFGMHYPEDFETTPIRGLPAGWGHYSNACGDYAHVEHVNGLTLTPSGAMADSVLVLFDELTPDYVHPHFQDNFAMSPTIDLTGHLGLPGRVLDCDVFRSLPLSDHVFMYWQVRYKPACDAGAWSPWANDNCVYYSAEGPACAHYTFDASTYIPPSAEEAQVGLGVVNYCSEDPWNLGCTHFCNVTPYFDNVTFGVFGSNLTPLVSQNEKDYFMDQFAEDGTLNPLSTADTRISEYLGNLVPPIFGDTMVARSAADNCEVWLVFRMAAVSPKQTFTDPFFTTWFPGVAGGGWIEVRMDTAEVTNATGNGTVALAGNYATCFHEADPTRLARGLGEVVEILPNNVFQPGTRIEYYLKAHYTGTPANSYLLPAAGAAGPEEFEILPMYTPDGAGSVEWPCLVYVDHFGQRGNDGVRNSDRTAAALTAAGYEFDMFNRLGPSSDLRNGIGRWAANTGQVGGPGDDKYNWGPGATIQQFLAYSHAMVNCGNVGPCSTYEPDASMLQSWLTVFTDSDHPRFLWMSGDDWARALHYSQTWYGWAFDGRAFLNDVMAATYVAADYADFASDYTYCLPVNSVAGGAIMSTVEPYQVRQNGSPRSLNVIGAAGTGVAEEEYNSAHPDGYVDIAAVSNAPGVFYRTFIEAYDWCLMRDGSAGPLTCGVDPLAVWFDDVLTWAGLTSQVCGPSFVDVKEPGVVPAVVTSLGQVFPNPMNPTATINYTIGTPGRVQLRVFDVSGRVIRTLVDEPKAAGTYSVIWDGKNDDGQEVASSIFFYELDVDKFRAAKKVVILR